MEDYFIKLYSLEYTENEETKVIFEQDRDKLQKLLQHWKDKDHDTTQDKILEHRFNTVSNMLLYINFKLGTHKVLEYNDIE